MISRKRTIKMFNLKLIKSNFKDAYVKSGKLYFDLGKVVEFEHIPSSKNIFAKVQGEDLYDVNLKYNEQAIVGHCSCPVANNCKHVVAVSFKALQTLSKENLIEIKPVPLNPNNGQMPTYLSDWADRLVSPEEAEKKKIAYLFSEDADSSEINIEPIEINVLKNGSFGAYREIRHADQITTRVKDSDRHKSNFMNIVFSEGTGSVIAKVIQDIIDYGHMYWGKVDSDHQLIASDPMPYELEWVLQGKGVYGLESKNPYIKIIPSFPLFCIDTDQNKISLLKVDEKYQKIIYECLNGPQLPIEHINSVAKKLGKTFEKSGLPPIPTYEQRVVKKQTTPLPILKMIKKKVVINSDTGRHSGDFLLILPMFRYGTVTIDPQRESRNQFTYIQNNILVEEHRNREFEKKSLKSITLQKFNAGHKWETHFVYLPDKIEPLPLKEADQQSLWMETLYEKRENLEKKGWQIDTGDFLDSNWVFADEAGDYMEFQETTGVDWLSAEIGVSINGEKVNLVPVLVQILKTSLNLLSDIQKKIDQGIETPMLIKLEQNKSVLLPLKRAHQFLVFLQDLYHKPMNAQGQIELTKNELMYLSLLEDAETSARMRWVGPTKFMDFLKNLAQITSIPSTQKPSLLKADLRPYQQQGFEWLVFLAQNDLAGVLADDMGLGKTVQTLSYITHHYENQTLNNPVLIIAPTSLMINWAQEIEKFTPHLKYLILHGQQRSDLFDQIQQANIVLTTYPLLYRDHNVISKHHFHTIILDEAQTIKNAKAQTTLIVQKLKSNHRFCLSGTPLENHLGELWSLFHFLMPGFLGNDTQFKKNYRFPIEKENNAFKRQLLLKKIKPFVLRRTKQEVVKDLPPKTEIILKSKMDKEQRDLYETIRSSLHKKVQEEIKKQGFERSQIIILDALLKLRQICCDPRLLKTEAAKNVKESAKLDQLTDILKEMIEEGRSILLFSQFTSMLTLIEERCVSLNIPFVKLTGQTKNRKQPVEDFQSGKAPLFLISLKAGGTGLNLTTADTVIHYDPWWNPAVEQQATDRAHRIGQQNPVFVYKMIIEGTIEEKILELQAKKGALARAILDGSAQQGPLFTNDDIESLLAS
jgi:SNF2 family DNA or RNA helicase